MWSFRLPDRVPDRVINRLPGAAPDLPPPQVTELKVAEVKGAEQRSEPVHLRLTRYRPLEPSDQPPVLLIHGYSASGTTFVHPTLRPGLGGRLVREGRDVWVLDLRSSAGMRWCTHPVELRADRFEDIPVAVDHVVANVRRRQGRRGGPLHGRGHAVHGAARRHPGRRMRAIAHPGAAAQRHARPPPPHRAVAGGAARDDVAGQPGAGVPDALCQAAAPHGRVPLPPGRREDRWPTSCWIACSPPCPIRATSSASRTRGGPRGPARPGSGHGIASTSSTARCSSSPTCRAPRCEHLDDFFGPMNVETVTQVIHFARTRTITDGQGRHVFATRDRLRDRLQPTRSCRSTAPRMAWLTVSTADLLADALGSPRSTARSPLTASAIRIASSARTRATPSTRSSASSTRRPERQPAPRCRSRPSRRRSSHEPDQSARAHADDPVSGVQQWRDDASNGTTRIAWASGGGRGLPTG